MRGHRVVGVVVLTVGLVLGPGVPAGAQAGERSCLEEAVVRATPGLSTEPTSGSISTGGETGTLTCGEDRASFGLAGRYGTTDPDTCASGGEGWGVFHFTFADGETIYDPFTYTFGKLTDGSIAGSFAGDRFSGTFTATPTEGDCVTSPVTSFQVRAEGTLRN